MLRWFFGYRCEISYGSAGWCGHVFVPRWHPIRAMTFGDSFIFLYHGEWIIPIEGCNSFHETYDNCVGSAGILRHIQDDWDNVGPYEREYKVW